MTYPRLRSRRHLLAFICLVFGLLLGTHPHLHAQGGKGRAKATPTPKASPTSKSSPSPAAAGELPEIVATINGEVIARADLTKVADALLSANGRTLAELSASDKRHMYQTVLEEIISDHLIYKAAVNQPIDEIDVEKQINQIRQQYPTAAAYEEAVKKAGQTIDGVKANIRTQLKQAAWIEAKIADDIKIEPLEVEKFYKEGPPAKFDTPEMIRASHILVGVRKDAPPEAVMQAQDRIKILTDRLAKGESFESLAKQYSDDPNAKQSGGDLDYFSRERIMPEVADAAFRLKIGEVSAPVRTQFGFHLIKLTDRRPAHSATLEEAREQITTYLQTEKRKTAVAKLINSLKADANVDNRLE